uniref:Uncharacterized protein n=1 Tax=Picea glauca TaxID=3330 RepID=A0A101LYC8_PICGL|nr:hypothetical protein ABT39_MTgene5777 [Picea glauca]QHR90450.1 hypothetical protein Q903MT_gene4474 [Picea sitchensis]
MRRSHSIRSVITKCRFRVLPNLWWLKGTLYPSPFTLVNRLAIAGPNLFSSHCLSLSFFRPLQPDQ